MNETGADAPDPEEFTDPSPNLDGDTDLPVLAAALVACGVARVVCRYDGSGDSGAVADVDVEPEHVSLPRAVEERLRAVAEGYCPKGYEINEGGFGTLTLYPRHGLAEREHNERFEDSQDIDVDAAPLAEDLRQLLVQLGVACVTARFDGCGDSGQLDEFTAQPESAEIGSDLEQALEDFLLELLPGGWEINEGSYGTFSVDVSAGLVVVDAYWRVEGSETHVTRWRWR